MPIARLVPTLLLAAWLASAGRTLPAQEFVPEDVVLGDAQTRCLGLEFSPDMRFLAWTQQGTNTLWICGMNRLTGDLVPSHGRGFAVANVAPSGNPQWGTDTRGHFLVAINTSGELLRLRPGVAADASDSLVSKFPLAGQPTRQYPFPTRLPQRAEPIIAYLQFDPQGIPRIYYTDFAASPPVERLAPAPPSGSLPTTFNGLALTIYRWFPESTFLCYGFLKGSGPNAGSLQMAQFDASRPDLPAQALSDDASFHIDDFPSLLAGGRFLAGGINQTKNGAFYRVDPVTQREVLVRSLAPGPSAYANPTFASSFEPFLWNGVAYSAFQITDGGGVLTDAPAEIWLTSLVNAAGQPDASVLRRLSGSPSTTARDPEYFLGETRAWIFYYGKAPGETLFSIHRCATGLPTVTPGAGQFANLSTRARVGIGEDVLIGGLVIQGPGPKRVLVRAMGPGLAAAGVASTLADPRLDLFNAAGQSVASNDQWGSTQAAEIQAAGLAPGDAREAALIGTLAPGLYTAIVSGVGNQSGVALVEAYDLDAVGGPRFINLSTRARVQAGENLVIAGLAVRGQGTRRVLIRGIGPSLAAAGVAGALQNPSLELISSLSGAAIAANEDWQTTDAAAIAATGLAPSDPREAAILLTLGDGLYTALLRGSAGTSGVGLVEVYDVP